MLIDWFTVGAQIVNFLILVALLKKFLYGPVVRAMDARQTRIADRLREAEEAEATAQREAESYREKQAEIEREKERILSEARREAEERKENLTARAREEVEQTRREWLDAVQGEKESFLLDLKRRAAEELAYSVRKALHDLADEDLEGRLVDVFLRKLRESEETPGSDESSSKWEPPVDGLEVVAGFNLDERQREKIVHALKERFPKVQGDVRFESSSDVICGIRVRSGGHRLGWSLEDYVENLERNLTDMMDEELSGARPTGFEDDENRTARDDSAVSTVSDAVR